MEAEEEEVATYVVMAVLEAPRLHARWGCDAQLEVQALVSELSIPINFHTQNPAADA